MNFWKSLAGMLCIRITSADPEKMLDTLISKDIGLQNIEQLDLLTFQCRIQRSDWRQVKYICKKAGCMVSIIRKEGIYWLKDHIIKRPVLLLWFLCFLIVVGILPTRVFFFQVAGNVTIPERKILEAAENCGIVFGASRRVIRSEKMKNALLGCMPELQWAGINTFGSRAVISVKEREQYPKKSIVPTDSGIIAIRDGIITECTITNGSSVCTVGQAVKKNQMLISPYVDCGLSIKVVHAEGEIFANTNHHITSLLSTNHTTVRECEKKTRRYSIIVGKKRMNLQNGSGISDTTCGRMYEEYYITLPGGYQLPLGLAVETIIPRTSLSLEVSQDTARHILTSYSKSYVSENMIAGTVLTESHTIEKKENVWILSSDYVCNEMIGRIAAERNGVIHE